MTAVHPLVIDPCSRWRVARTSSLFVIFLPTAAAALEVHSNDPAAYRYLFLWRVSLFFSTASLAGAFSGLLAFAIVRMNGIGHQRGWSWIFILEGLFTTCFGIFSFLVLPQSPDHARFLSSEEKTYIANTLKRDGSTSKDEMADNFTWREVGLTFTLPQVWMLAFVGFSAGILLLLPYPRSILIDWV